MMKISIVAPVYNEESSLETLAARIIEVCRGEEYEFEIILVDDGSTDHSPEILERMASDYPEIKVILFQRNFGQAAALAAGFDFARGDVIVTIDSDLQNDPGDIPVLISKLDQGYDIVSGWRRGRRDNKLLRIVPSIVANRIIKLLTGVKLHDIGCTLKAYRTSVAKRIHLYGDLHRFVPVLGHGIGARIAEVEVRHHPRKHGMSKYGIGRVSKVIFDLITIKFLLSFSNRPMHFFGYIALFVLIVATFVGGVTVYLKWFSVQKQDLSDNPLLYLTILLIVVGVQFLATGLLAEINSRTYHEARGASPYVITRKINFSDQEGD